LAALGGNTLHESSLHGLTASGALALDVGGTALGGRESSDKARNLEGIQLVNVCHAGLIALQRWNLFRRRRQSEVLTAH
jgi:hypothetical protein